MVSQKAKISQRVSQKGRASQKTGSRPLHQYHSMAGSHRRQGGAKPNLATGMSVSHMTQCRVSHNRQGNKGFSHLKVFSPVKSHAPELVALSIYCSHTRAALAHFLVGGRMDTTGPGHSSITEVLGFYIWSMTRSKVQSIDM